MTFLSNNKQFEYFQRKFNSKITHSPSRLFYGHKRIQPSVLLYVSVCVWVVVNGFMNSIFLLLPFSVYIARSVSRV